MRKVVHGVNTPLVPRSVMMRMLDAIHYRIAHVHVGMRHVDLGPKYLFAVAILTRAHGGKQFQVLLNASRPIWTFGSWCRWRTLLCGNLFTSAIVNVREAFPDQFDGKLIELSKIVGRVPLAVPLESQPADIFLDAFDIFRFL